MNSYIRAELRRTGGFTDRSLRVVLDSATLPLDQARELRRLVEELDLTRVGAEIGATCRADLTRYELAVENGGRHWRATVCEPTVPRELRPLLRFLTSAARAPLPG
ncbi:protealysin inhibitor emfourin [Actinoplanes sp. NPDC049802]|uniref:protealysin inhibitor emfourin n=1 Tax=Actinoplanes sp. NPDC049802 TaxID=3154742 RepID=UPI0033EE033A